MMASGLRTDQMRGASPRGDLASRGREYRRRYGGGPCLGLEVQTPLRAGVVVAVGGLVFGCGSGGRNMVRDLRCQWIRSGAEPLACYARQEGLATGKRLDEAGMHAGMGDVPLWELGEARVVRDLWPCWKSRAAFRRGGIHVDLRSCEPCQAVA